jgi:dynein heavy chain 1
MEAVCSMLGHKQATDWDEIRKVIRKDDFIAAVLDFDSTKLKPKQVEEIERKFLADPSVSVESVHHASKACGPLFQWATSQVSYCTVVARVTPLREEVAHLQQQSQGLREGKDAADTKVHSLGSAIEVYKGEYAAAIRDIDAIKVELERVKTKVVRAETLLRSLASEQGRWEASSATFDAQRRTLCGDGLLAAAFATYGGAFDHKTRQHLRDAWRALAEDLGVPHRADLADAPAMYLSKASQRLQWHKWGLPSDDLCVENAAVLERFHRFPLVVDPSGMATRFLVAKYADQRLTQTSFLDASFLKALASAVRFGLPLLVHDAEHVDPVLNPVLNRELQKNGRRTLVRLGGEDVDYNPKFLVFLVTRNPVAQFAPDLCSRVTLVNFTVTSLRAGAPRACPSNPDALRVELCCGPRTR